MKETYNYEASEGNVLLGVPYDLRYLDYDSPEAIEEIANAVIAADTEPDWALSAFNCEYKEYCEIAYSRKAEIDAAWREVHPEPSGSGSGSNEEGAA